MLPKTEHPCKDVTPLAIWAPEPKPKLWCEHTCGVNIPVRSQLSSVQLQQLRGKAVLLERSWSTLCMPETAGSVTEIVNPERLSHLNRLLLLFVPFTCERKANQHWRSTFNALIFIIFFHFSICVFGSPINTAVVWVQVWCSAVPWSITYHQGSSIPSYVQRGCWVVVADTKPRKGGVTFSQHWAGTQRGSISAPHFGAQILVVLACNSLLQKGPWCFTGVSQGPAGTNPSLYLTAAGTAGVAVSCWKW